MLLMVLDVPRRRNCEFTFILFSGERELHTSFGNIRRAAAKTAESSPTIDQTAQVLLKVL